MLNKHLPNLIICTIAYYFLLLNNFFKNSYTIDLKNNSRFNEN